MQRATAAEALAREAVTDADEARGRLIEEQEAAKLAAKEKDTQAWVLWDAERREARAKGKAEELQAKLDRLAPPTKDRTVDEWAALSDNARYVASLRERDHLLAFLTSHSWRHLDVADVLQTLGWVRPLFDCRPFFDVYFEKVGALMKHLEKEEFGVTFGLYLHYEARLTFSKILSVSHVA